MTHHVDLAVIIHALKVWRNYIVGMRFMNDHNGIRYLFEQRNMNVKKGR